MGCASSKQGVIAAAAAPTSTPDFSRAPSHRFIWTAPAVPEPDQDVLKLDVLPPGVQDVLRRRAAMVSGAGASGSLAAAAVLSSVYGHITKLARIVVRHAPLQCAGEPLETQAESLAQEYIRFLLLQMIDQQNPSSSGSQPILSNPPLINKLWVSHILETQSYQLLCQHLVPNGCAIHYSRLTPAVPETADRMQYTLEAYRDAFSSEAPTKWWADITTTEPPKPAEESAVSPLETPGASQGGKG